MKAFLGGLIIGLSAGGLIVGAVLHNSTKAPAQGQLDIGALLENMPDYAKYDRPVTSAEERENELLSESRILLPGFIQHYDPVSPYEEAPAILYRLEPIATLTPDLIEGMCIYSTQSTRGVDNIRVTIGFNDKEYFSKIYAQQDIFTEDHPAPEGLFAFHGIRSLFKGRFDQSNEMKNINVHITEEDMYRAAQTLMKLNPDDTIEPCESPTAEEEKIIEKYKYYFRKYE